MKSIYKTEEGKKRILELYDKQLERLGYRGSNKGYFMNIREYNADKDFSIIKDWITDERTHAMWCANRTSFPLQKESFDSMLKDIAEKCGDRPFVDHDMTKTHHISFIAAVSSDRIQLVKLYPEGNAEARFRINGVRRVYFYCNRDGLFYLDVVKGIDDRDKSYDDVEERRALENAAKNMFRKSW